MIIIIKRKKIIHSHKQNQTSKVNPKRRFW